MKVAVWDTYVKKKNGNILHFDIVVPEEQKDETLVYSYGKKHLASVGEQTAPLSLRECRFCHTGEPTDEMIRSINSVGFYIIPMDEIPAKLPGNATRRDMILYLRGHFDEHRFANFQGVSDEELRNLLAAAMDKHI